jgi:hypothetical protein
MMQPKGGKVVAALSAATADTPTMVEPWKVARQAAILVHAIIAADSVVTVKVLGRLRSDGSTLEVMKDSAGNDWTLTPAQVADGGIADAGGVGGFGTIDLGRIDGAKYDGVAFRVGNSHADNMPVCVAQFLFDLYAHPGDAAEGLFDLQPSPVIANT